MENQDAFAMAKTPPSKAMPWKQHPPFLKGYFRITGSVLGDKTIKK